MLQDWIWLTTRKALGPRGVLRVLEYFGTPERAFYADSEQYDQIPELPAAPGRPSGRRGWTRQTGSWGSATGWDCG